MSTSPLPFQNVTGNRSASLVRNNMKWYVPQVGIINMYINPQSMRITEKKIISSNKTKGGFSVSYFGEELTTIHLTGHTGTSGIEGINVLYEIYRAEQYLFDQNANMIGLANQNVAGGMTNFIGQSIGGNIGLEVSNIVNGVSGVSDPNNLAQLNPRKMNTLADVAFGVELYYLGLVHRGYFTGFNISEQAENFLIGYDIDFTVTQKRGYRVNNFPFFRSAAGPSQYDSEYSYNPYSKVKGT